MIEFIPVMLFILGWHPDRPGEIDLQRIEIVFATTEMCEAEGSKIAERMSAAALDKSGARYQHRCVAVPKSAEYETAYREWNGESQ